jgi:hypothetical protein
MKTLLLASILLAACGGSVNPLTDATPEPDAGDASADGPSADGPYSICYLPSNPFRAYSCATEADCSLCPASCNVADAGEGECKP